MTLERPDRDIRESNERDMPLERE